jgi:hypothetical protein
MKYTDNHISWLPRVCLWTQVCDLRHMSPQLEPTGCHSKGMLPSQPYMHRRCCKSRLLAAAFLHVAQPCTVQPPPTTNQTPHSQACCRRQALSSCLDVPGPAAAALLADILRSAAAVLQLTYRAGPCCLRFRPARGTRAAYTQVSIKRCLVTNMHTTAQQTIPTASRCKEYRCVDDCFYMQ